MKSPGIVFLAASLVVSTTASSQDNHDLGASIRERNMLWNESFQNRDTSNLFSLFSSESILATAGGRWIGGNRCRSLINTLFKNRPDITWINSIEKVEVFQGWNIAYETGSWIETWTEKGVGKSEITGKYWIMYDYRDDAWVIHSSIFTPLACNGSYCK